MRKPNTVRTTLATNKWIKKLKSAKGLNSDTSVILMIMNHALNGLAAEDLVSMDIKKFKDDHWPITPRPERICFRLGGRETKLSKKHAKAFSLQPAVFHSLILEWAAVRNLTSFE